MKWLVRKLAPGEDNRTLLKTLKATGETRVILDCPAHRVLDYLRQAREVNFFEDYMVTFGFLIILFFVSILNDGPVNSEYFFHQTFCLFFVSPSL